MNMELGKKYLCTKSFTHGNFGRVFRKGKTYTCTKIDSEDRIYWMSNSKGTSITCGLTFIDEHFVEA